MLSLWQPDHKWNKYIECNVFMHLSGLISQKFITVTIQCPFLSHKFQQFEMAKVPERGDGHSEYLILRMHIWNLMLSLLQSGHNWIEHIGFKVFMYLMTTAKSILNAMYLCIWLSQFHQTLPQWLSNVLFFHIYFCNWKKWIFSTGFC